MVDANASTPKSPVVIPPATLQGQHTTAPASEAASSIVLNERIATIAAEDGAVGLVIAATSPKAIAPAEMYEAAAMVQVGGDEEGKADNQLEGQP